MKQNKLTTIEGWVHVMGKPHVLTKMISAGFSVSMAEKLVTDRYDSKLNNRSVTLIKDLMFKDGFELVMNDPK